MTFNDEGCAFHEFENDKEFSEKEEPCVKELVIDVDNCKIANSDD